MRTRTRGVPARPAISSGPRLRGAEDLEAAPALDDRRVPEGLSHARPNRIRALACAGDEPQVAALDQPGRSVHHDAIDDHTTGADRGIREDVIEGQVRDRLVQNPGPDFPITDPLPVYVPIPQRDGALLDVGQQPAAPFGEARGDDPHGAPTPNPGHDR